jgi:non-ribosomal peptide synthetase component F
VPVGYPIPGIRATIGAPGESWRAFQQGELFLHSAHLFLGDLNREDETASRFVQGSDGRTYYRTGDLAVRLPDGSIAVRGRVDQQMKFHGVRIEPGDIESRLLAFPGVCHAAVKLGRIHGQDALLAYRYRRCG